MAAARRAAGPPDLARAANLALPSQPTGSDRPGACAAPGGPTPLVSETLDRVFQNHCDDHYAPPVEPVVRDPARCRRGGRGLTPAPLLASDASAPVVGSAYWQGFVEFWAGGLKKQSGVVLTALGVGAVSLFIITRGKWQK